jgi:HlyD family secretion protein
VPSGSTVRAGSVLIEFDTQNQIKIVRDRQADYRDLLDQIERKKAEQAVARARDETELRQTENDVRAARLDLRQSEVLSRIDAEKNRQAFDEAEAHLKQLRASLELRRAAASAELRILEIQRDRALAAVRYSERNVERMNVRSPINGLVVLMGTWKGDRRTDPAEGDEVRPGIALLQVVDSSAMRVRARVNQADVTFLRLGQPVRIQLDAYPKFSFPGTVQQIAAIASASSFSERVRTFNTIFSIEGTRAELLPDLSASVDVDVEQRGAAVAVPRDRLVLD